MSQAIATADDLLNAESELETEIIEVPGWGNVKVKALSIGEASRIAQTSSRGAGESTQVNLANYNKERFRVGLVAPKLDRDQVNRLYHSSGPRFRQVLEAIDRLSSTTPEELRDTLEAFPEGGSDESGGGTELDETV